MQKRLDQLLVERKHCSSIESAKTLISSGLVQVDGKVTQEAGQMVPDEAKIELTRAKEYVSRGAFKILPVIKHFAIKLEGMICADVGSSTGGFTEVLLKHGARKVYAIDVGYGELDWSLRKDPRVEVMERTNARHLESLPETIDFATVDVSFISLKLILPNVKRWLKDEGEILALVKPQFEAAKEEVGEGGIISDFDTHKKVLFDILNWCGGEGFGIKGMCRSGLEGAKGNREFFVWLVKGYYESKPLEELFKDCL